MELACWEKEEEALGTWMFEFGDALKEKPKMQALDNHHHFHLKLGIHILCIKVGFID